jgi:hypothetical protein
MKYIIERAIANNPRGPWERSSSYNGVYSEAEAQNILDDNFLVYRTVRVIPKYRRHAAVTPLELRGAMSMLTSAMRHLVKAQNIAIQCRIEGYSRLYDARNEVMRQLEAMEKN